MTPREGSVRRGIYDAGEPWVARDGSHAKRVYFVALLEVLVLAIVRRSVFLIALLALASCDDDPVSPFGLFVAKARWERANIDSYEMTVRRLCGECPDFHPVRLTVSGGVIVSRIDVVTGEPISHQLVDLFPDVPGLFALVDEAAAQAHDLSVTFHPTYGFPTVISIDWVAEHVDDEVAYRVEDFAVR